MFTGQSLHKIWSRTGFVKGLTDARIEQWHTLKEEDRCRWELLAGEVNKQIRSRNMISVQGQFACGYLPTNLEAVVGLVQE